MPSSAASSACPYVSFLHLANVTCTGAKTLFFIMVVLAFFFAAVLLLLCCGFYHQLKRRPWPRWLSAAPVSAGGDEIQVVAAVDPVPSNEHSDSSAADCAVCLGAVEKSEAVRRLPACKHVFHVECIDMWLRKHVTCPVCRRAVALGYRQPPEVVVDIA